MTSSRRNVTDLLGSASSMPGIGSAELYSDTAAQVCKRSLIDLFDEVRPLSMHAEQQILDIGCGTGETTISLYKKFHHVQELCAIDISAEFVDYAKSSYEDDVVKFRRMNAENEWPAEWENKFTTVFSYYVLHWIKDHNKLFANISKCMQPNGDLIVQFFHSPLQTEDEMMAARKAAQECDIEQEMQNGIMMSKKQMPIWKDMTSYAKVITSLGFTIKTCKVIKKHFLCSSKFERAGMTVTVSPFMLHVPKEKRMLFATKYVNNLKDPYVIHHNAVVIHAIKKANES